MRTVTVCLLSATLLVLAACETEPEEPSAQAETSASSDVRVVAGASPIRNDIPVAELGFKDGPADTAIFDRPLDLALDADGNVLIVDSGNRRIRKLGTDDGIVSTVAGSGEAGAADGPALEATFRTPVSIAVASDGTIVVADAEASMIRAIGTDGRVTTVAGVDMTLCTAIEKREEGEAPPAKQKECPTDGEAHLRNGQGLQALFSEPAGVAIDSAGTIFVSDAGNHCIRSIDKLGIVRTFAGSCRPGHRDGATSDAEFTYPGDLAFGPDGSLYVNQQGQTIRRISPDGQVSTVAGNPREAGYREGVGADALFSAIAGLAVTSDQHIAVVDAGNQRVRTVSAGGGTALLAGRGGQGFAEGPGDSAQFSYPTGIVEIRPGVLLVADSNLGRIFEVVSK
jgi:DNA-binding beta-propeller fold protein YncE